MARFSTDTVETAFLPAPLNIPPKVRRIELPRQRNADESRTYAKSSSIISNEDLNALKAKILVKITALDDINMTAAAVEEAHKSPKLPDFSAILGYDRGKRRTDTLSSISTSIKEVKEEECELLNGLGISVPSPVTLITPMKNDRNAHLITDSDVSSPDFPVGLVPPSPPTPTRPCTSMSATTKAVSIEEVGIVKQSPMLSMEIVTHSEMAQDTPLSPTTGIYRSDVTSKYLSPLLQTALEKPLPPLPEDTVDTKSSAAVFSPAPTALTQVLEMLRRRQSSVYFGNASRTNLQPNHPKIRHRKKPSNLPRLPFLASDSDEVREYLQNTVTSDSEYSDDESDIHPLFRKAALKRFAEEDACSATCQAQQAKVTRCLTDETAIEEDDLGPLPVTLRANKHYRSFSDPTERSSRSNLRRASNASSKVFSSSLRSNRLSSLPSIDSLSTGSARWSSSSHASCVPRSSLEAYRPPGTDPTIPPAKGPNLSAVTSQSLDKEDIAKPTSSPVSPKIYQDRTWPMKKKSSFMKQLNDIGFGTHSLRKSMSTSSSHSNHSSEPPPTPQRTSSQSATPWDVDQEKQLMFPEMLVAFSPASSKKLESILGLREPVDQPRSSTDDATPNFNTRYNLISRKLSSKMSFDTFVKAPGSKAKNIWTNVRKLSIGDPA